MSLRIESDHRSGTMTVDGEIDLASAPEFERALVGMGERDVVGVDLGRVGFIDSTGIAVLVRALGRTARTTIRLLGVSPAVRRTLEICGIDRARGLEIVEATPSLRQCPCCGAGLVRSPAWVPAQRFGTFRPGDGYCPECELVLSPEMRDGERGELRCPTHPGGLLRPGVGPGAQSRWEVATLAYGRNRRRWMVLRADNSELRRKRRALMTELGNLRRASASVVG